MQGPGGHSWADFGHPNPIQSLATAIHTFSNGGAARRPGSSFNFGVIRGGISVNAIPSEASMEVDLRSVDAADLDGLDYQLKRIVADSARAAGVAFHIEKTGDRPSGATPPQSTIVQAALEASRAIGVEAQVDEHSYFPWNSGHCDWRRRSVRQYPHTRRMVRFGGSLLRDSTIADDGRGVSRSYLDLLRPRTNKIPLR